MPPAFFTYPFASSSSSAAGGGEGAAAAPGEGSAGFVMLEGTEAIGAEMLRQAQEEAEQAAGGGPQQGEYELAQLGAFSARRAADVSDDEDGEEEEGDEEEEEEEEEDTLSLSGLPKDLRGICRRLRGEPPSDDDEEEEDEQEKKEQDGSLSRPASPLTATPRSGKKTKRRSKSAAAAAGGATGAPAPSFLCWAWPLSAREALFWLVALAFLASLAVITLGGAGGRYRRHYSAMGRTRAGLARRACAASAAPPPTAGYYYDEEERAGAGGGGTPLFLTAQEARRLAARVQAGETEAAGLRAVLRDREEELAWMRSAQYGLETQVRCLQKQLAAARKEADTLRAAAVAHRTAAAAANEAPGTGPSSRFSAPSNSNVNSRPRVVQVIPEARVVKAQPSLLHGGHWFLFGGSAPSAGNGNATAAFHPPLWFHWSAGRGNKGLQRQKGKQEAAAAAVKAASFVPPPPQSAPRSYAEMGVVEEEGSGKEVEVEGEEEEEEEEEDNAMEEGDEEEEEEDSEWEEWDEEWSDEDDEEWWSDEDDEWSDDEEDECWCDEEEEAEQEKASFPAFPWPHEKRSAASDAGKGKAQRQGKQGSAPPLVLPQDFADACAAPPASPLLQ